MKRELNGILLLDKPIGITSNDALQQVKRIYNAKKAGHTGSLDPIATGMLPLCFGEATKFSQFLLEADKQYFVTGKLGVTTASADTESPVLETREVKNISEALVEEKLAQFRGKILQLPSMYSALKHQGQPLYKFARQGIDIKREPREITIHELKLLKLENDLVTLFVRCSKGTYVRTLIADLGEVLGCGAHVIGLRRTTVGCYKETQMITLPVLQELKAKNLFKELDALLLPVDSMLEGWEEIILSADMVFYLLQGNPLVIPRAPTSGWVKFCGKDGRFLGVGEVLSDGKIAPRRLIATN